MDLSGYRNSPQERQRTADLVRLMPARGRTALDIGARDGHFSLLLAARFERVIALDLTCPVIAHPAVECVEGNAAALQFPDRAFDFVFCAEVLEHIPTAILEDACREIARVAARDILIGVPYRQDIRVGRTTCQACGQANPPWGHVNSFDEQRLQQLFPQCAAESISFIGQTTDQTNALSAALMDYAGNPYGTYDQQEPCVHCGKALGHPPPRNPAQLIATKLAFWARAATGLFAASRGAWMHVLLRRTGAA